MERLEPIWHDQCPWCILRAYGCVVCAPFEPVPYDDKEDDDEEETDEASRLPR